MKYLIDTESQNITIKDFLRKNHISSNLIKRLKKLQNGILVNGSHQNVTYKLQNNDCLEINIDDYSEDTNVYLEPKEIPLDVIYEDENLTVVNKPSGMPTHESLNNRGNSLANALLFRYQNKPYVFRATNRLDKDTSGVVITANNRFYASYLSNMIKEGKVEKEYIAVVYGEIASDGEINAPIGRIGESIIKRIVRDDGEEAYTKYKVLKSSPDASVLLVTPITGRTHQIRVHMAHIGHPIIGDSLYGGESALISRQALHCLRMKLENDREFYAPLRNDISTLIRSYFKNEEFIPKN